MRFENAVAGANKLSSPSLFLPDDADLCVNAHVHCYITAYNIQSIWFVTKESI